MGEFDLVRQSDWVMMLRTAAEAADLPVADGSRRRHLLESLRKHIGARMATAFDASGADATETDEVPLLEKFSLTTVGASEGEHEFLQTYLQSAPHLYDPICERLTRTVLKKGTILREEFADDRSWEFSDYFNGLLRPMRVDDQLSAKVILPNGKWSGMAIIRETGDPAFTEREKQIVALFNQHAGHLYDRPKNALANEMEKLPPRLRPILQGLLAGDGDKQIAFRLGFSTHTVNTYVKQLYRLLGISGRSELFLKFSQVAV